MNKIAIALLPFLLTACAPKKGAAAFIGGKHIIESQCPENGECRFEVLKDKKLVVQNDATGMPYYSLEDNPGKVVMRYTYEFIAPKDLEDAQYQETIIFETDNELSDLHNASPKNVKMLFGVQCFCRGKAGYYRVEDGLLDYSGGRLAIKLNDSIVEEQRLSQAIIAIK
ncbi:hypothetical protein [uncultured Flavobacterium sp.]|uniref:hypothetical protein n=1 Tax=uncultured Flavobacterium sp. TaxID=165435 RepID=UPI0025E30B77|nr:hypothetical protein [uncultured Flavobacterium sp.]